MKNSVWSKKSTLYSIIIFGTCFALHGMDNKGKEQKKETLENWRRYISSEKNKKTFHPYYFYEQKSSCLLENIAEVDKDEERLSEETLNTIGLLDKTCSSQFDISLKKKSDSKNLDGLNTIICNKNFNNIKRIQIFDILLSRGKQIGASEYAFLLLQSIYTKNGALIKFFMDLRFASFMGNFFNDVFILTKKLFFVESQNAGREQIEILHFFLETVENWLRLRLDAEKKLIAGGKEDSTYFNFLTKLTTQLFAFLNSPNGYTCFASACHEKYWDFIDYDLERPGDKIGLTRAWDILIAIAKSSAFSDVEKDILLRHFISRSHEQKTLKDFLIYNDCALFLELTQQKNTALLQYALYAGPDLHQFNDNGNVLISFLDCLENQKISFHASKQLLTTFLSCFHEKDRDALLNDEKGTPPLIRCYIREGNKSDDFIYEGFEMFKFLVHNNARPWHLNDRYAKNFELYFSPFSIILMLNTPIQSEHGNIVAPLSKRWKYIAWMVEYAKKNKKLEELLNHGTLFSPLLCALMDTEDQEAKIAHHLMKHGAQFTSEMLMHLITNDFFHEKEKSNGLKNIFVLIENNELAKLFDTKMDFYSENQTWKLVQELERSKRKDIKACLYGLYLHTTKKTYEYIQKKIKSGESKKIVLQSPGIMNKLESVMKENESRYTSLHAANNRYGTTVPDDYNNKINNAHYSSIKLREKYKVDPYATI